MKITIEVFGENKDHHKDSFNCLKRVLGSKENLFY